MHVDCGESVSCAYIRNSGYAKRPLRCLGGGTTGIPSYRTALYMAYVNMNRENPNVLRVPVPPFINCSIIPFWYRHVPYCSPGSVKHWNQGEYSYSTAAGGGREGCLGGYLDREECYMARFGWVLCIPGIFHYVMNYSLYITHGTNTFTTTLIRGQGIDPRAMNTSTCIKLKTYGTGPSTRYH